MSGNPPRQSALDIIKNFGWILKRVIKYSPGLLLDKIIRIPVSVIGTYFSVNLTRWILERLERDAELLSVIFFIIFVFSFFIVTNLILSILSILWVPQKQIDLSYKIRQEVICKISKIDQKNFQDTTFFNSYTLALNEIDNRAIAVLDCLTTIISASVSFFVVTGVTGNINSKFAFLGIIATLIDVGLGVIRQRMNYRKTLEVTPENRKRGYIGRVTYQPEFTSDLKIYSGFIELLLYHYKNTTQKVKTIIWRFSKKILLVDQCQQIPALVFRQILPWVLIAILLKKGEIVISEATVLVSAALTIPNTLTSFMNGVSSSYSHSLYIENLKRIIDYDENIECSKGVILGKETPLDISVRNISFSYESKNNVVNDISFNIHQGEKISIVGYNGAGKSTLVKLLVRLFDVDSGDIIINGQSIRKYDIQSLRSKIAFLSQDYKIYSFSIAENILMRPVNNEKDIELVYDALRKVGLFEKVMSFDKGIHTFITREFDTNGQYLSGGEIQKLVLARMYIGNYDCVILDESTSALDPISESEIIDTIFEIFEDKTIIMISHRLVTIKYTDTVYFLENGKIIEFGSHQELMRNEGEYSRFYLSQANKYSAGE